MFSKNPSKPRFARCIFRETDIPVSHHAAMDLSEIAENVRNGIPISTNASSQDYYDGSPDCTFELPLEQQRGVDINDCWNASKDVSKKMSKTKITEFNLNPSRV